MDLVTLSNEALALAGERMIMSLDDASNEARLCKRFIHGVVTEVLRDGVWHFARKRVVLAPLAEAPAFGWTWQYQLPGDFIRLVELNGALVGEADCPLFTTEGRRLLMRDARLPQTDVSSPIPTPPGMPDTPPPPLLPVHAVGEARIVYIRDITVDGEHGIGDTDALFDAACAYKLASKLAWPLQQSRTLKESLEQSYATALQKAKSVSSREAFERQRSAFDWHGSRFMESRFTG